MPFLRKSFPFFCSLRRVLFVSWFFFFFFNPLVPLKPSMTASPTFVLSVPLVLKERLEHKMHFSNSDIWAAIRCPPPGLRLPSSPWWPSGVVVALRLPFLGGGLSTVISPLRQVISGSGRFVLAAFDPFAYHCYLWVFSLIFPPPFFCFLVVVKMFSGRSL